MDPYPEISTKLGRVSGRYSWTAAGSKYYYFKGIPYAKSPVGDLRFKGPQPPEPWDGVRDCSFERSICPQPRYIVKYNLPESLSEVVGLMYCVPGFIRHAQKMRHKNEDCLYLNVYTTQIPLCEVDSPNLPVLVWIHGGGFVMGDGNEDTNGMDFFLDRGAVVVVMNYRLGPFGFLSVGTEAAPGNAGLKDQAQALRWVRDNIAAFGGDPNRVTLFGTSAGAAAAHLHTVSPLSRGLFHRVIACSGTALSEWALTRNCLDRAKEFAKLLGIEAETPDALVSALRSVPARDMVKAMLKYVIFYSEQNIVSSIQFVPVLEPPGEGAFLCEHPEVIIREGRQAPVPIVSGINNREGTIWFLGFEDMNVGLYKHSHMNDHFAMLTRFPEKILPADLASALSEGQRRQVAQSIIKFYCGEKGLCEETTDNFVELIGDVVFILKFLLASRLHTSTSRAPLYLYHFTFDGKIGVVKYLLKHYRYKGVAHGDELSYLLSIKIDPTLHQVRLNDPELEVRNTFVGALFNFIKTGNPNPENKKEGQDFVWEPASSTNLDYLEINRKCAMRRDKFGERYEFWNELYRKYLNKPLFED